MYGVKYLFKITQTTSNALDIFKNERCLHQRTDSCGCARDRMTPRREVPRRAAASSRYIKCSRQHHSPIQLQFKCMKPRTIRLILQPKVFYSNRLTYV